MNRLTAEQIDQILHDKYVERLTVAELRAKHKISQKTYTEVIKAFGDEYLATHEVYPRRAVDIETMKKLWGKKNAKTNEREINYSDYMSRQH